jgi:hypothetical protein
MSQPRGRRTRHVAVYLSDAEAAAWDQLRDIERGAGEGGFYPPSRAAWIVERVVEELARCSESPHPFKAEAALRALQALDEESERLGPPDDLRSHGRRPQPTVARRASPGS